MRRKVIVALALLNGLLVFAAFAPPAETQVTAFALFPCCQNAGSPEAYCCVDCCWFVANCNSDEACQDA